MRFYSDNTATACPEILAAITEANQGLAPPYGEDRWTQRLDEVFGQFFGTEARVFAVATGTAANALSLATIAPPYSAIFAHPEAHVVRDEYGAPEFFAGGARLVLVGGEHAKVDVEALGAAIEANAPSVQPAALSLAQATEYGTVYRPAELAALSDLAHRHGLRVHMDGARFANAVVFLDCPAGEVTWRAGVDVLSFGATKNGALAAEAVVFFDLSLVRDFEVRRRRAGHLLSKSRYVSAQLLAYLETGVWRANAIRANELARRLAQSGGTSVLHPVEANEVFLQLGEERKQELRNAGFEFYDWGLPKSGEARFVVSWDQSEQSVAALCAALSRLCGCV
jgi:threonine aldolase